MNSKIITYGSIGALVLGLLYFARDNVSDTIRNQFAFEKVSFSGWKFNILRPLEGLKFRIDIDVRNLLPSNLQIQNFLGDIYLGNQKLTSIAFRDPLVLVSNEVRMLSFDIDLSIGDLANNILGIITSGVPTDMTLRGNATVAGQRLPIIKDIIRVGG